jgi:hypothetical protein
MILSASPFLVSCGAFLVEVDQWDPLEAVKSMRQLEHISVYQGIGGNRSWAFVLSFSLVSLESMLKTNSMNFFLRLPSSVSSSSQRWLLGIGGVALIPRRVGTIAVTQKQAMTNDFQKSSVDSKKLFDSYTDTDALISMAFSLSLKNLE